jgi:hypothetical protein
MEKMRTSINEKWMDKNGILWIKPIEGSFVDLVSLKEDDAINPELTGGKKVLALYDGRANFTITPEARAFVRSGILNKSRIATAVVTDKSFMRILVNFINIFSKPKSPLKMFNKEKDAINWLNSFKN